MRRLIMYLTLLTLGACTPMVIDRDGEIDARPTLIAIEQQAASGGIKIIGGLRALAGFAGHVVTMGDSTRKLVVLQMASPEGTVTIFDSLRTPSGKTLSLILTNMGTRDTLSLWGGVQTDSLLTFKGLRWIEL